MPVEGSRVIPAKELLEPPFRVNGAVAFEDTPHGFIVCRLPDWTRPLVPSAAMARVVRMPIGVYIEFDTDAEAITIEAKLGVVYTPPRMPHATAFDLEVDGVVHVAAERNGDHWLLDPANPELHTLMSGNVSVVTFRGLGNARKHCRLWLPHNAIVEVRSLSVPAQAKIWPAKPDARPRWTHYGSSISHCIQSTHPSGTWAVAAARRAGWRLNCFAFAGECHLDPFVARSMAAVPTDLISLKIGINIISGGSFSTRTLAPAVHGFLDLIREMQPQTPLLIVSPIHRQQESVPEPTPLRRVRRLVRRRQSVPSPLRLTPEFVRSALEELVNTRRDLGDHNIHYLSGLHLFGPENAADMPDGVHPNEAGYALIGERFAEWLAERIPTNNLPNGRISGKAEPIASNGFAR